MDINAYALAVARYVANEYTDYTDFRWGGERDLAEQMLDAPSVRFVLSYALSRGYDHRATGDALVLGASVDGEAATLT